MALIDIALWILLPAILFAIFQIFGRWLPAIPKLNPWPVKAHIFEMRGNGYFPKEDLGRTFKDMDGNVMFSLKSTGIKTPPRKLVEALRGADKKDHIFLLQTSRENVIPISPEFAVKIEYKGGEKTVKIGQEQVNMIAKNENIFNWKKYKMKDEIRKIVKEPGFWQKNFPLLIGIFMVLVVGVFFVLVADPFATIAGEARLITRELVQAANAQKELAETNLEVVQRLERIVGILES